VGYVDITLSLSMASINYRRERIINAILRRLAHVCVCAAVCRNNVRCRQHRSHGTNSARARISQQELWHLKALARGTLANAVHASG